MSPSADLHLGADRGLSARESSRQLEGEIARLRSELGELVAELDKRRHELTDIKLQAKRHALGATLTGVGLLASAAGFVWLGAWRARRNRTTAARIGRLREAVASTIRRPPWVAAEAPIPVKILTAAANAAVATAIKKGLERALQYALRSRPDSPQGRVHLAPRQPDRLGRTELPGG